MTILLRVFLRVFVLFCSIGLFVDGAWSSNDLEGVKAPGFSLPSVGGGDVSLRDLLGEEPSSHVVVLNFFRTDCVPCIAEIPEFEEVLERYKGRGVRVVLVSVDDELGELQAFVKKREIDLPILFDKGGERAGFLYSVVRQGKVSVPQTFCIGKDGIIKDHITGKIDGESLSKKIEALLAEDPWKRRLTILYTNSTNGYLESCDCESNPFGGLVRRATAIEEIRQREPNVVLVDSGDLFPPRPERARIHYTIEAMKGMGYDAVGIGDQEFILGWQYLKEVVDEGHLPFLCANVQACTEKMCFSLAPSYTIKNVGPFRVAIIAILPKKAFYFFPKKLVEGLKFQDPVSILKKRIPGLREKADLVVVLSHGGASFDKRLAKEVEGIDLICGGHSQTLIKTPERVGNTLIVQAGEKGQHLGHLVFHIPEKGRKKVVHSRLIALTKRFKDNPRIRRIITEYEKRLKEETEGVLFTPPPADR